MRFFLPFLSVLFFAAPLFADTPDELIKKAKLPTIACLSFVDDTAVKFRQERWGRVLRQLPKDYVLKWISGQENPPKFATEEARRQRNCLIQGIAAGAANGEVIVDGAGVPTTQSGMKKLKTRSTKNVEKVARNLVRSHYRAATTQSSIWRRKFFFSGRSFNVVSKRSAKKCKLKAGSSWKPGVAKHRRCWAKMASEEREQEILLASSAPGISRHHWGTEFDIFGLNPRVFFPGKKLYDEYTWMKKNARQYGVVQPYTATSQVDGLGYMEERWHWSYQPIAGALLEYARENESDLEAVLNAQWDALSKRWGKKRGPYFEYVRKNWRAFVFNVE